MGKYYSKSLGGFVDPVIMVGKMPEDAVELTEEQYAALMSGQLGGGIAHDSTGTPVIVDPAASFTLDQIKSRKLAEIASACSAKLAAIKAGYPPEEVESWPEQKAEAVAYAADKTAATPLLSATSAKRGIALPDLVARVTANAAAWSAASGALIGKRQAYADAVTAAADAATVTAVVWTD